jgi:hypothetical protein
MRRRRIRRTRRNQWGYRRAHFIASLVRRHIHRGRTIRTCRMRHLGVRRRRRWLDQCLGASRSMQRLRVRRRACRRRCPLRRLGSRVWAAVAGVTFRLMACVVSLSSPAFAFDSVSLHISCNVLCISCPSIAQRLRTLGIHVVSSNRAVRRLMCCLYFSCSCVVSISALDLVGVMTG